MSSQRERWERWFLFALILFGAATRVVFLLQVHDNPFFNNPTSDAYYYDAQGVSIANGDIVGNEVFFRAPGYPYWLGTIYAIFGHNYVVVRVIQHLLGVVALLLLYFLSRRLFSPAAAVLTTILAACYPVLMYFEGQLLFDSFLTFLCLAWLVLVVYSKGNAAALRWFFIGFLYGVICVTRPTFLPLAVPLSSFEIWRWYKTSGTKTALRVCAGLMIGLAVAVVPVTLRNYIVSGDVVVVASQGGINFYIGNNPEADGFTARMPSDVGASWEISEMTFAVEKQLGHRPTPSEESNFWYAKGLGFVSRHPAAFLKLLVKKFYLFWNAFEIPNNLNFYTFSQYSSLLRLLPAGFWFVGPFGLLGMMYAWTAKRSRFVVAFTGMYCLVMVAFFVCDRYRLPVVPIMCMFSAYMVVEFFDLLKRKKVGRVAALATLLLVLIVFVNSNVYQLEKEEPAHQFYMLGLIDQKRSDYKSAAADFEKAASYGKPIRNLYLHWGTAELILGREGSAREKFKQELIHHPGSYGAFVSLSEMFLEDRRLDSALVYGDKAIALRPFMSRAYISVGQAYSLMHNLARAESVLSLGSIQCGNGFRYGNYLLAGILLERGDIAQAENNYRSILKQDTPPMPGYEPGFLISEEMKIGIDDRTLRAKAFYGLGHVYAVRRQIDSAIVHFTIATQLSPDFADAWADLGVAFLQMRKLAEADTAIHRAITLQPDNFMYWYNYGSLLAATDRYREAKEAFEKTLQLRSDFAPAQQDLKYTNLLLLK